MSLRMVLWIIHPCGIFTRSLCSPPCGVPQCQCRRTRRGCPGAASYPSCSTAPSRCTRPPAAPGCLAPLWLPRRGSSSCPSPRFKLFREAARQTRENALAGPSSGRRPPPPSAPRPAIPLRADQGETPSAREGGDTASERDAMGGGGARAGAGTGTDLVAGLRDAACRAPTREDGERSARDWDFGFTFCAPRVHLK